MEATEAAPTDAVAPEEVEVTEEQTVVTIDGEPDKEDKEDEVGEEEMDAEIEAMKARFKEFEDEVHLFFFLHILLFFSSLFLYFLLLRFAFCFFFLLSSFSFFLPQESSSGPKDLHRSPHCRPEHRPSPSRPCPGREVHLRGQRRLLRYQRGAEGLLRIMRLCGARHDFVRQVDRAQGV